MPFEQKIFQFAYMLLEILKNCNFSEMIHYLAPQYSDDQLFDYGCTGRGQLNPIEKNFGDPIDKLDKEINHWKQCRKCTLNYYEQKRNHTQSYLFDKRTNTCREFKPILFQLVITS